MLRITIVEQGARACVKLEGRLVGPWAEELWRSALAALPRFRGLDVDISDITFADSAGEDVLLWLHQLGAQFLVGSAFSKGLFHHLKERTRVSSPP